MLALVLAGCITITSVVVPPVSTEAGPATVITLQISPDVDLGGEVLGTLAIRLPAAWTVTSVVYSGSYSGTALQSNSIATYFTTVWDAYVPDKSHNGPRADSHWWGFYTPTGHIWQDADVVTVTITVDTHLVGGEYLIDFVTGVSDPAAPEDPATNGTNWELGGAYAEPADPTGVVLDQTISLGEGTAPTVVSTFPATGATVGDPLVTPRVAFSEAMKQSTLTAGNIYVKKAGGGPAVPAAGLVYNGGTNEVSLNLAAPLEWATSYVLLVDGAVADEGGKPMGPDYIVPFTTPAEPVAAQVIARDPGPGSTGIPVDTNVSVTFDQDMDAATITGATFTLKETGAVSTLPAVVSYIGATRTAVLDPAVDLGPGTEYQVTLAAGLEGANGLGIQGAPVVWTFTTESEPGLSFTDVLPGHPFYAAIQGMADLEIINGYAVGAGLFEFRPNNPVWRWQFAKMIVGALGLIVTEAKTSPFTDLDPDTPSLDMTEYVAVAWEQGITKGKTATLFGPYDEISRTQVVTMVVRALQQIAPETLATPPSSYVNSWGTGYSSIHGPLARIAEYNGLLAGLQVGPGGAARDPWSSMPRGEVAQVLWNMMALLVE